MNAGQQPPELLQIAAAFGDFPQEVFDSFCEVERQREIKSADLRYYPAIFAAAKRVHRESSLPSIYKKAYIETCSRNKLLLLGAERVRTLLAQRGIASMLLKSAALISHYEYPLGIRYMSDVDLLIKPHQVKGARILLAQHGWLPFRPAIDAAFGDTAHSVDLVDNSLNRIDLHWQAQVWSARAFDAALWQRALPERERELFFIPDLQELFFVTCSHGGLQYPAENYWVIDAMHLLETYKSSIDWDRQLYLLSVSRHRYITERAFLYLHGTFHASIPETFISKIAERKPGASERFMRTQSFKGAPAGTLNERLRLVYFRYQFSSFADGAIVPPLAFMSFLMTRWHVAGIFSFIAILSRKIARKVLPFNLKESKTR